MFNEAKRIIQTKIAMQLKCCYNKLKPHNKQMKKMPLLLLSIMLLSCHSDKPKSMDDTAINCPDDEHTCINVTGDLFLDSKGNALLDFPDTLYNGKLKLVCSKVCYQDICNYYDAFLSMKNIDRAACKISIYGHYVEPVDTIPWICNRRDFHTHNITFYGDVDP